MAYGYEAPGRGSGTVDRVCNHCADVGAEITHRSGKYYLCNMCAKTLGVPEMGRTVKELAPKTKLRVNKERIEYKQDKEGWEKRTQLRG